MDFEIKRVAVIGAGWMGTSIAALLASAGLDTTLLDVLPPMEPTEEDLKRGLTRFSDEWRSSLAISAIKRAKKFGAFLDPEAAEKVHAGNVVDHLALLSEMHWILESVPEVLDIKRAIYDRIEPHLQPGTLISSNTSGLKISELLHGRSKTFARQFFISHFFNPVRHMRLMELVTSQQTDPLLAKAITDFATHKLGKVVISVSDAPYFVANQIGLFSMVTAMSRAHEMGISVKECDMLTGEVMARANSATFRTADIVGLDALQLAFDNLHGAFAGNPCRERFNAPAFFRIMVEKGYWGDKADGGFYRLSSRDNKRVIETIDLETLKYDESTPREFESLKKAEGITDPRKRIKALVSGNDDAAIFAWAIMRDTMNFSALQLGESTDQPIKVDRAMKCGYNWELGPFEIWDSLGVEYVIERMKQDGIEPPPNAIKLLEAGHTSWYSLVNGKRQQYVPAQDKLEKVSPNKANIDLDNYKNSDAQFFSNDKHVLYDLGQGIACLSIKEPNSKGFAINEDFIETLNKTLDTIESKNLKGLAIFSGAENFSLGQDPGFLFSLIEKEDWKSLEQYVDSLQKVLLRIKQSSFPLVASVCGNTFGTGYEMAMHCGIIHTHVEGQFSLNNLELGLTPFAGGCKEMLYRAVQKVSMDGPHPIVQHSFDIIINSLIAKGAYKSKQLGMLRKIDKVSMGVEQNLFNAVEIIKEKLESGHGKPPILNLNLPGPGGAAAIELQLQQMKLTGKISDHEATIGKKLAHVLTGGNCSPMDQLSENHILELEKEAFLSLCGYRQTKERIEHFIRSGKVLKN